MKVTSVKIHLIKNTEQQDFGGYTSRLLAFATVVLEDELVLYDLRVLRGDFGLFVGMPCRKVRDKCPNCMNKNVLQARYCNHCGKELKSNRIIVNRHQEPIRHMDIAHPITPECRDEIRFAVIRAYREMVPERV